ncbi:glycoside hydrolase family 31 protein [Piedraia hortae CBS 480.64]|uniref:alpha-glucosidase n=1 Tax=Piedraia hortae CBS 480.64 TaxID=1314780 RepID=A0A6A7C3G5_9PEZI|nr:glycoside hydrolase family 31 protein [Piedraia hortae CBS 480.64]
MVLLTYGRSLSIISLFSVVYGQAITSAPSATVKEATSTSYSVPFTIPVEADVGAHILPNILDPKAVQAQDICPGYKASDIQITPNGVEATLTLAGPACNVYGTDIDALTLEVELQDEHRLRVAIQPAHLDATNATQYILPDDLVDIPKSDSSYDSYQRSDLRFYWSNDPTFSFSVIRKSTGDVLFDTVGSVLVYENQFIEFVTKLPADYNIYGLGEHFRDLRLGNNYTATMYNADAGNPVDYNSYGTHPIYYETRYFEGKGKGRKLVSTQNASAAGSYESLTHGVYLRNAHAHEVLLRSTDLTWRTLGGTVDLYFFDGPTQDAVTKQYLTGAVGLPAMQQYWTLGFHQCRWGYKNWSMLEEVIDTYRSFDIPLETIWTDIDSMFQYRDFTNDPNTFPVPAGQSFLQRLHSNHQHYVPIVDAAIYIPNPDNASDAYDVYSNGQASDLYMKNPDGSVYIGAVWPGYTVFTDWFQPEAISWWADSMKDHHDYIPWDGIWLDMNEVASFCIGSCGSKNLSFNPAHPPFHLPGEPGNLVLDYPEGFNLTNATEAASTSLASALQASATSTSSRTIPYHTSTVIPWERNVNHPPYAINHVHGDLAVHALSPNATHHDGTEEYDVHNLYGSMTLHATYEGLLKVFPDKRPFIIGRSTFAGAGKWSGHWGGDNEALFAHMYFSISQALTYSLFGVPMFGVDTCGFSGNSDEELCNRWMQLSAFFPFYRNHNVLSAIPQEAYVWESVAEASRKAMKIRYSLLPYMYTLLQKAHTTGSTVMRALAWEFTTDPTLAGIDNQFLLGPSLLVTPVLGQGLKEAKGVFPGVAQGEVWYDWYTKQAVKAAPGENKTIPAPLGQIPLFVRGGSILPMQEPLYTTTESRNSPWSLLCALSTNGTARGEIYIDDGESLNPNATRLVDLKIRKGILKARAMGAYRDGNPLANITIMGVASAPKTVTLNGVKLDSFNYDKKMKSLTVTGLEKKVPAAWEKNWKLTWGCKRARK